MQKKLIKTPTFIQKLGGNKQTNEMVEFARGILTLQKHQGVKSNFIDAVIKYVVSDPAIKNLQKQFQSTEVDRLYVSFNKELPPNWTGAGNEYAIKVMEFWWDLYDKGNKFGGLGLYYALALRPEDEHAVSTSNKLFPAVKKFDDIMQQDSRIADKTELKLLETYKAMLIDGINLSNEESSSAFDFLMTDIILSTKVVEPRDENVYAYGMTVLCQAEAMRLKEMNRLKATELFEDNQSAAKAQGYKNINKTFHQLTIGMLTLGNLGKSEEFVVKKKSISKDKSRRVP